MAIIIILLKLYNKVLHDNAAAFFPFISVRGYLTDSQQTANCMILSRSGSVEDNILVANDKVKGAPR